MSFSICPTSMYDAQFTRLSPEAQRLEWLIRTHPEKGTEGLSRFRFGYVEDLIGMERLVAKAALTELLEANRPFMYDGDAGVILDKDALKVSPIGKKDFDPADWRGIENAERRVSGAISRLKALPETPLLKALYVVAMAHSPQLAAAMKDEWPGIEDSLNQAPTDAPWVAPSYAPNSPVPVREEAPTQAPTDAPSKGRSVLSSYEKSSSRDEEEENPDPVSLVRSTFKAEVIKGGRA